MRVHAFAALLAFPLLGLSAPAAKADRYCCGNEYRDSFVTQEFYVIKHATVFGCDGYHCETNVVMKSDHHVKARCRNGWCQLRSLPFKNAWVLKSCLKQLHSDGYDNAYGSHSRHKDHSRRHDNRPRHHRDDHRGYKPRRSYKGGY